MYKRTITYKDYNGNERTEDYRFNLTEAELTKMQLGTSGGMAEMIKRIIEKQDAPSIMAVLEELIDRSYGERSLDGKRFMKSKELTEEFKQTEAYSILFMDLVSDDVKAAEFVNGIMPESIAKEMPKIDASTLTAIQ